MNALTGLKVWVVEDEGLILLLLEDYLNELGCEVVATASRLEQALSQARVVMIDLAVLDVNLAGQLSYPVAQVLRERCIPFIFATGYGAPAVPAELQSAPVLCKPFELERLNQALCLARQPG